MYWENVNHSDEQSIIRCNHVCCFQLVGWWSAVLYLLNSNLLNLVFTTYSIFQKDSLPEETRLHWLQKKSWCCSWCYKNISTTIWRLSNNWPGHTGYTGTQNHLYRFRNHLKCTKPSYKQDLLPPRASKSQTVQCLWDHHWDNTKQQDSENHKEAVRRFFDQNRTFWFIRQSLVHCSIRTLSML